MSQSTPATIRLTGKPAVCSTDWLGRVLVACEFSGIVRDAFSARGWDAWSCDLEPSEKPGNHIQDDVFKHLDDGWEMLVFFWPCTWATRSGARWLYSRPLKPKPNVLYMEERRVAMIDMAHKFRRLLDCKIPLRAGENPLPYVTARKIMGEWSQIIQPWMFGHGECKQTCLWLRGLPPLQPTHRRDDLFSLPEPAEREARIHRMAKGPNRSKDRSRTYTGVAEAMADQWTRAARPNK